MEKEIFEIITKVQNGEQSIGEAQSQLLLLFSVNRCSWHTLSYNDGYMKSLGLRSDSVSKYDNVNARDELTIIT